VILVVLVVVSLTSLATGTRAIFIRHGVRTAVLITAYPFLKALTGVKNGADYVVGMVVAYDAAKKEAETMRQQLGEMMLHTARRNELIQENRRLRRLLDFVRNEPGLTLEPVDVIESFKGILMIDRGAMHGIRESMCAVSENGIVGLVTQADPMTANVETLYSPDCKTAAMIARNRVRGVVQGSTSELSPYCTMNFIDMKDEVRVGDLVVASPESIFPTGYPIGKVTAVHDTKSLWKSADVEPVVDPYRLEEVFILRQAPPSIEELAGVNTADVSAPTAPDTPDDRSLQERYAP